MTNPTTPATETDRDSNGRPTVDGGPAAEEQPRTTRRGILAGVGAAGLGALAGCMGFELESSASREPALVENRPDAVYFPTHTEGMEMVGMASDGDYKAALTYTWPHRFWTITGRDTTQVDIQDGDSAHLMTVVWDADTGVVTPDVSPNVTVRQDGERVTGLNPWPMLSQPMGFHFGDNVPLDGDGEYQVEVSVGEPSGRRTGSLEGAGPASFEFEMAFERSALESLRFTDIAEDREGTRGAVPPMEMEMLPATTVPEASAMPGDLVASGSSGDAEVVVAAIEDARAFGGGEDETYLAVSPRTPYNRFMLPLMSLSATVTRGGETVFDDVLHAALDANLSAHYGAVIPGAESGDEVTVTVDSPPQVSRHEGYETAFVEMDDVSVTL